MLLKLINVYVTTYIHYHFLNYDVEIHHLTVNSWCTTQTEGAEVPRYSHQVLMDSAMNGWTAPGLRSHTAKRSSLRYSLMEHTPKVRRSSVHSFLN